MKDFVMAFITALCVNLILIGVEIALSVDFSFLARLLIALPATVMIVTCTK